MKYELGESYVDKGGRNHPEDQFLRWINIDGSGMLNSPGIRPLSYVEGSTYSELPAYLILVTHERKRGSHNPWEDLVDLSRAEIHYWGDAKKHETKRLDDFQGNATLRAIHDYLLLGDRTLAPPILHFSKPKKGVVLFNGLCCLEDLRISWFDDGGKPVRNYHAYLRILDCHEVYLDWLHARASANSLENLDSHRTCPKAWLDYKNGRTKPIDIWQPKLRTKEEQLPSDDQGVEVLRQLSELDSYDFEKVVVSLFASFTEVTHHIEGTKATGDGGFDFFGSFVLPRPIHYEIRFRGEVKRYAPTNAVDPKSVSRLVARLTRGEYGVFVTTSYFTQQAQREVLEDGYPVHLISGADLVFMLKHQRLTEDGGIRQAWLSSLRS